MSVKRLDFSLWRPGLEECDYGSYVHYDDYADLLTERDRYKNLYEAVQQTTKEVLLHGEQERDRLEKAYLVLKMAIESTFTYTLPLPWIHKDTLERAIPSAESVRKGVEG